ncbi:MAG TPA: type II toxin-antitoxin system RelE/ParE family toxin [Tepidisphaeraceae bacterium]|jgi:plasmid stabilization system protein ParE
MVDRYRIRMMPRASNDIVGICTYIEQRSPQNAAIVAKRLLDAIDSLEILPHRYKIHEHRKDTAKTVHAMPVPPFIVYYRVVTKNRSVEIIAVLHGSRRQPRRFR